LFTVFTAIDLSKSSGNTFSQTTAIGVEDFKTFVQESAVFVDKSMLLKDFLKDSSSLLDLSHYLHTHFEEFVYILIDDYDSPLNHAYLCVKEKNDLENIISLFRNIFGHTLKENTHLKKGLLAGIFRLKDANNLQVYSNFTGTLSKYFGFSIEEVKDLFAKYGISDEDTVLVKK